jgi:hypothetical protein
LYGCHAEALSAWGQSVTASSSASDAVQLMVAYCPRRHVRYDGEDEYRITVLMKAFNMTALDIFDGLRLELGISTVRSDEGNDEDESDAVTMQHLAALGGKLEDMETDAPLTSMAGDYMHELKSGEYVTWETTLDPATICHMWSLVPSVVYRNIPIESDGLGINLVGEKLPGEGSTVGGDSQDGEDDFKVAKSDEAKTFHGASTETEDIRLIAQPLVLPPLVSCQPCHLVFYANRCGDLDSFRFLWFRFPFQLAPMKVVRQSDAVKFNPVTQKVAAMSLLTWEGEAIPGGVATHLWAFASLTGDRVFCILTEADNSDNESAEQVLHFRGDNQSLLYSFVKSKEARDSVVSSLLPEMTSRV